MKKLTTGYCDECGKYTKQIVIECNDNLPTRIFETVITLGLAATTERRYECECTKCGEINTLYF